MSNRHRYAASMLAAVTALQGGPPQQILTREVEVDPDAPPAPEKVWFQDGCPICKRPFKTQAAFDSHMTNYHGEK